MRRHMMYKITVDVDGMACGMCEAHVNDAVRKARKAGISVISIFFGDDSERSTFVKMYEKNCIITEPEGIDAELVRLMKRFCFR